MPVELVLQAVIAADPARNWLAAEHYNIVADDVAVGTMRLRIGDAEAVHYIGHVGYAVEAEHRGHGYAAMALRQIVMLAERHDLRELWIMIRPDNLASQRAASKAGAVYIETIPVPPGTDLYARGDLEMQRYRLTGRAGKSKACGPAIRAQG